MEKKFKVESYAWYGLKGATGFFTFEEAKQFLRSKIVSEEGASHITDQIKSYANQHYPENTPAAFGQLIDVITRLLTDPDYPQNIEDVVLEDFEDDNIEFYMDSCSKAIYCYVNNDEYDGKFPVAEINVMKMDDEEEEYFFFLTEKKDGMCWSWNVQLSPAGDEDEVFEDEEGLDLDYDFDDFEDQE